MQEASCAEVETVFRPAGIRQHLQIELVQCLDRRIRLAERGAEGGEVVPPDKVRRPLPHRLRVDWSDPDDTSTVTWTFTALAPDRTLVEVVDTGFSGDAAAIVARALDSTGGFHLVLAGAKAWLEHGLALELVRDSLPQADCGDGDEH